jgi:ParB family protein of integrating conjugative element (PFGI_1 class)
MSAMSHKTPEALTASARAAQLATEGKNMPTRQSIQERRASLALSANNTVNAARQVLPGEEFDGSSFPLHPKEVAPYDRNPRQRPNPAYESLKASIRARGYEGTFVVTKRPGESRYMLAAGGNTSLAIIHELLEEEPSNPRWQLINVIFKKWPGEAAVLAAHLAENDARGETTFWDKACGVADLKAQLQTSMNRPLSAQEVSKEAARMGADYGVRAVKTFLFAVESLAPIGPWLTFSAVQDSLSPAFNSLLGLAEAFAVTTTEFRAKTNEALEFCATVLRSREVDGLGTKVELDLQDVLSAMNEATAKLIGVDTRQLGQMLSVRATHPRMSAAQLRQLTGAAQSPQPAATSAAGVTGDESPSASASEGAPVSTASPPSDAARASDTADSPSLQLPLGPMLAAVPASDTSAAGAAGEEPVTVADPTDPRHAPGTVRDILKDITAAAELGDVVYECEAMPLGYYVELPEGGIETCMDGQAAKQPALRKAAWHILAALSGQYDRRLVDRLPDDARWKQLLSGGEFASQFDLQVQGAIRAGACYLPAEDVHRFLWHPQLGHLFLQLWSWALHWRQAEPARFPGLQPVRLQA